MKSEHLNTATDWPADPIALFREWYEFVQKADVPEPETMALCSATPHGKPSARMVLLRGIDELGFRFYTNYESRKGQQLIANPHAAAVFYWREPYLQVRIEGTVEKVAAENSDAYFDSRNRAKRASAIVSQQSRPIGNWNDLRTAADELTESDEPVPRPAHWGGFRIIPDRIEFWAGSQDRMHRRCEYTKNGDEWTREMLAP